MGWMDGELSRLNQEVADMQNAGSLTGRKKAAALAKGLKAQETLNKYSQCNVFWQPIDAAPLTTGGNGYVDGGDVDISNFERDNYPAAPLTDGTDGYSEPKTVDSAPLTDDSYSETKTWTRLLSQTIPTQRPRPSMLPHPQTALILNRRLLLKLKEATTTLLL